MKKQNIYGIILILVGLLILLFYPNTNFGVFLIRVAATTGMAAVVTGILLAIVYVFSYSKKVSILLIIGIAFLLSSNHPAIVGSSNNNQEKNAEFVKSIDDFLSGKEIKAEPINTEKDNTLNLIKNYFANVQAIHLEFDDEIQSANLYEMIEPENITDYQITLKSREKINKLSNSIPIYNQRLIDEILKTEEIFSKRTDKESRDFMRGFARSKEGGIKELNRFFQNKKEIVDTIGRLLDIKINNKEGIYIEDGQAKFAKQEVLDEFNNKYKVLVKLDRQEQDYIQEQQNRIEQTKERLDDYK